MKLDYHRPPPPAHATHRSAMLAKLFDPPAPSAELEEMVRRVVREELRGCADEGEAPVVYRPTIAFCIELTSAAFGVPVAEIVSKGRHRRKVEARQAAMWLAFRLTGKGYAAIGRAFKRDHTTVIHAIRMANEMRARDAEFANLTNGLSAKFQVMV